jgi:cell division protein FtsX
MSRRATLLIESTGDKNKDKEKIEQLKRENKGIRNITILDSDPKLDKMIADISGAASYSRSVGTNAFMIEVKVDNETELKLLEEKIRSVSNNIKIFESY